MHPVITSQRSGLASTLLLLCCALQSGGAEAVASPAPAAALPASPAASAGDRFPIRGGRTLVAGQKIWLASGNHYLIFQTDGNLVVYTAGDQYVWGLQSVTDQYSRIQQVQLQADGNLAAYGEDDAYIWLALHQGPDASAYLDLSPQGVLQRVSGNTGAVLWSSSP